MIPRLIPDTHTDHVNMMILRVNNSMKCIKCSSYDSSREEHDALLNVRACVCLPYVKFSCEFECCLMNTHTHSEMLWR